ncbi:hypothetical protein B7463_g11732, partial [Scytalidium lignicola]
MHLPTNLTVGQVAGIINAAVIIAQISFPLIMVFVVVDVLSESYNAATWSVLGRLLNNSKWPYILRSDSVTKRKVSKRVLIPSTISSFGVLFLGVVGSVTPLGLSSVISQSTPKAVPFQYTQDDSPIGQATTSHSDYVTNRLCGYDILLNCPGSDAGYKTIENATGWYGIPTTPDAYISSVIAPNITEVFTSGTSNDGNTISSVFDIQYRSFIQYNNSTRPGPNESVPWVDQGRPRSQGETRFYQSLILNNQYQVVEGVVLDLISGGIGFRNHTIPPSSNTGFVWEEDLLWIEPETSCVNLNVTVDYAIEPIGGALDARITDRGGITNLPKYYPTIDMNNTQLNPVLYDRAWVGAVLTDYNFMIYFNETRDETAVGKTYSLDETGTETDILVPNQISVTPFGDGSLAVTQGFGQMDNANMATIMATTGLMLGAGSEVDASGNPILGPTNTRLQPLTNWSQPLYSCASTVKASVKHVSFQINGNSSISNLVVTGIQPVTYSSNETLPLWAVENTGLNVADVSPEWLYLPAGSGAYAELGRGDGSAGAMAPAGALNELYNFAFSGSSGLPDYSGQTNYPMFLKWKNQSSDTSTAPSILNLIWTDLMANFVMGSKSQLSRNGTAPLSSTLVSATPYTNTIKYNYIYAIPAFCFLVLYTLMLLVSLAFILFRRVHIGTLRMLLNQTSTGRAVTTERHGHRISARTPTNQWIDVFGDERIKVKKFMAHQKYDQLPVEGPYSPYAYNEAWDMGKFPSASQVQLRPE